MKNKYEFKNFEIALKNLNDFIISISGEEDVSSYKNFAQFKILMKIFCTQWVAALNSGIEYSFLYNFLVEKNKEVQKYKHIVDLLSKGYDPKTEKNILN